MAYRYYQEEVEDLLMVRELTLSNIILHVICVTLLRSLFHVE